MKTIITSSPEEAANFVLSGEIVAFPTETVYGLGASVYQESAISKIFVAKGRPVDNPLIVHISSIDQITDLCIDVPSSAATLIDRFFPGPITVILRKRPHLSPMITAGLPTIGIRMPRHEVGQLFLKACGSPIAAPSANRSGLPSPTTWNAVFTDLEGRIPCILAADQTEIGLESTVVDCTGSQPVILRTGAVTLEQIQSVLEETVIAEKDSDLLRRSPGTRYRHYAPHARVVLVHRPEDIPFTKRSAYIGINTPEDPVLFEMVLICVTVEQYARELYNFFRHCDTHQISTIYCQLVDERGVGHALMDRLKRASQA